MLEQGNDWLIVWKKRILISQKPNNFTNPNAKAKNIQFTVIEDKENQEIFTFEKAATRYLFLLKMV